MALALIPQSQYLRDFGQLCPRCGSDRLDLYDREDDYGEVNDGVTCTECHLDFRRVFALSRYETLGPSVM